MDADVLTTIAGEFRASTVAKTPLRHEVQLTLPGRLSLAQGKLVVTDPFDVTTYVPGKPVDVDLTLLLKHVRFADTLLEKAPDPSKPTQTVPSTETIGGMPIAPPLVSAAGSLIRPALADLMMENTSAPPDTGVPGLLGAVTGTVKLPVEEVVNRTTQRAVKIELRVDVLENGVAAGEITYAGGVSPRTDAAGAHTPLPLTAPPAPTVSFPLRYTELTQPGPVPTTPYEVRVSIRLTVDAAAAADGVPAQLAVTTGWVELPPVIVPVPLVPVPTIVAMFTDKNYGGKAMVVVPANSAVGGSTLGIADALKVTGDLLGQIDSTHRLVQFLAGDAGRALAALVPTQYQVILAATDSIHDLSLYEFSGFPNRLTAEDSVSSIVVVAPKGKKVNFNLERTREDNTAASSPIVTTIDMFLAMANLADEDEAGNPKVTAGGNVDNWGHPGPRNDRLSAIYFP